MPDLQNLCYNCFHDNPNPIGACPYCGYDNIENRAKYPIALKAGSILNGQYIVGRVLGQGGFGITYLALDYRLNIKVAIKEYIPDGMATRLPETTLVSVYAGEKKDNFYYGSERFLDEARILARFIGNKNITAVKCFFEENNTVYFVMDYIEGISFKNYIKNRGGRVDYTDALRVLLPVMDALAIVHEEGLIHRDVTPDNIYITKDNEIKLLDFGSARYSLGDKSKSLDVILKAGYAPKEQYLKRGKQGPYTDVYSLSACFYASITGFLPPEALERMEEDEIIPISGHGIRIPDHLEAAIMKGLAVRAENRWQNIAEFRSAILGEAASEEAQSEMEILPVKDSRSLFLTSEAQLTSGTPTTGKESETIIGSKDKVSIEADISSGTVIHSGLTINTGALTTPGLVINTGVVASPEISQNSKAKATIRDKDKRSSNKNKVAAVISAAACILLIVSLIVLINNRDRNNSAYTDNPVTASSSGSSTEASQTVIDTLSSLEENVTDTNEAEKAAEDKAAADKAAADKAAADKAAADKAAADKAAADKAAADKAVADKAAADKAAEDKAAAEKAAEDKAAADKAAADKAAAEKAAAKKAAAEKAAAEKAAVEKAAAKKAAAEKAAAEKAAAEKAAECPYCDGTGKVECTWCEGTGISLETHQEDDGEYIYLGDPCPKKLTCDWCDGSGKR